MKTSLSIIIPTHKRAGQVDRLCASIAQQDFPPHRLQLLLVSNLKDKQLRERWDHYRSLPFDFKYYETGQLGVNVARNFGIRFAGGDLIYFLDDDCLLPNKNHLKELVAAHEKNPQVIGIGGPYKAFNQKKKKELRRKGAEDDFFLEPKGSLSKFYATQAEKWMKSFKSASPSNQQVSQLLGGNASYKREVFDRGFVFDPSITFGGSEESFNQLLIEQGWSLLYNEKLYVWHFVHLKARELAKKSFMQGLGAFKNRLQKQNTKANWMEAKNQKSHQKTKADKQLYDSEKEWAYVGEGEFSLSSLLYGFFFKLGLFYGLALYKKKHPALRALYLIYLILKSRLYFVKKYLLGWLYGNTLLKPLGKVWFSLGWLYGNTLLKPLGKIWFSLGWLYGNTLLKPLGKVWFSLGWLYGNTLLKPLGKVWFSLGWLYGNTLLKPLGKVWFSLGWLYGNTLLKPLGKIWFSLGWLYGNTLLKPLGKVWFSLGWLYGNIFLFLFYRSPLSKVYYFSKYQFNKRIHPLFVKNKKPPDSRS